MPFKLDVKKKLVARSSRVKSTDIHPKDPWVLVSLYDGRVHIWNYETQQLLKTFEVSDCPVRVAKFIHKENWIVCGSDDFRITIYNYNTSERVHVIDAHSDYVRSIVVHPTKNYLLSSSDDMTIKLWNWDKDFINVQAFEGHQHYVMQLAINPKDTNTFASASLDRTIRVWQLGSSEANFSLEGHERGVNCIDYYPGNDRPYLISGADDKTVKIWDYQTKTCIQTLEGHSENISAVMFYSDLPIIITASEDSTLRVWNMNTYRLEQAYNYGMERAWAVASRKNSNTVAIGYDNGTIVLKLGRDEPPVSMDSNGKIIMAKDSELQQYMIKSRVDKDSIKDGVVLALQKTNMVVTSEVYPQSIKHNSNGKSVVVCGDDQYIIYTTIALRNKDFGNALEFVWSSDPSMYATRDTQVKIFKNSKLHKQFRPDFGCEGIFGGYMLGVKTLAGLALYDWEDLELMRRIDVDAEDIYWSESCNLICITTEESFYVLKYNQDIVTKSREIGTEDYVTEDGYEQAFEVISEISETVKSGVWVADCFVYTNSEDKLNYYVGGEVVTVSHLTKSMYVLGYLMKENRVYLADKEVKIVSYSIPTSVLNYENAIMNGDYDTADSLLSQIPDEQRTRVAHFLEKQGLKQRALEITTDSDHKFDLAISLKDLKTAYTLVEQAEQDESSDKLKEVAELALQEGSFDLAAGCLKKTKDTGGLLLLATATDNKSLFKDILKISSQEDSPNIEFIAHYLMGNLDGCIETMVKTKCYPQAALMARSCKNVDLTCKLVDQWKNHLKSISVSAAESIAHPREHPHLFPDLY